MSDCEESGCWGTCTCAGLEVNFPRPEFATLMRTGGHQPDCTATNSPCARGCARAVPFYEVPVGKRRRTHRRIVRQFSVMSTHADLHTGRPITDFEVEMMDEDALREQVADVTPDDMLRACVSVTHLQMVTEAGLAMTGVRAGRPDLTRLSLAVSVADDLARRCRMLHGAGCRCRGCSEDVFENLVAVVTSLWSRMRLAAGSS